MVNRGFKVTLIVGGDFDGIFIPEIKVIKIPMLYKHISLSNDYQAYIALKHTLLDLNPDIIHTHQAKAGILGRLAALSVKQVYVIHTVHGPTFPLYFPLLKRQVYHLAEWLLGRYTHQFIFVGKELQQEYIKAKVCNNKNSLVIRTAKPDELIHRAPVCERQKNKLRKQLCLNSISPPFLMTYIARVVPSKKQEDAIKLLHELRKDGLDMHLAIVGKALIKKEKGYQKYLKETVANYKLSPYVHFSGYYENIYDVIEASDIIVLTSAFEGLPNVAIESSLLNIPLVSYEVSGLKELQAISKSIFTVEQGDIKGLKNKVLELTKSNNQIFTNKKSLVRLREEYSINRMIAKKMDLYKESQLEMKNTLNHKKSFSTENVPNATFLMRLFDIVIAGFGMIFVIPFCSVVMLLIWLEDKGTVFFLQERLGLNKDPFILYKFRSMRIDAEKNGVQWATKNDSRVTKVGKIIRQLHIDEIPQLWNIFKGDMSFVGPRPIRKIAADKLAQLDVRYDNRFKAKPGLTGFAQLYAPYGSTEEDQLKKVKFDLAYFEHFKFKTYIKIMFITAWRLLVTGKTSYQ